jgi:cytochrome bd ubiquinol oxidase subunit II
VERADLGPGLTVSQAAAGRSTLIATIVGVCVGAVVLVPSLGLLYTLVLRGRLDIAAVADGGAARIPPTLRRSSRPHRVPLAAAFAAVCLVAGVGLLVFADPAWAHGLGVVAMLACAVTVFALAVAPPDEKA